MNTVVKDILAFFSANIWLVQTVVILVCGAIISAVENSLYNRLLPRLAKTKRIWDGALLKATHTPLQVFIWALVISLLLPIIVSFLQIDTSYLRHISVFREVFFVVMLLWFALRFIANMEHAIILHNGTRKKKRDETNVLAVGQLLRVIVIIVGILVGMQTAGISIATLLAFGGVGGIAIGFAAKDTLANFIGGMMIFWDRPFSVGDWVRSPDRNIEGTVEKIGWRLTRIRTFDKRPLYVPNGAFSTISLENPSRMTNRRIKTTIGLRYDDATKVAVILKDVEAMLQQHPDIDAKQTLIVNLIEFGASSLNFLVYTFTKTTDWIAFQKIQQDVFLKIIDIISAHGAECAFPTTTVHVPEGLLMKDTRGEN